METGARSLEEPALDDLRLVGLIVIEDHINVEVRRNGSADVIEELAALDGVIPPVKLGDDLSGLGVEEPNKDLVPLRT